MNLEEMREFIAKGGGAPATKAKPTSATSPEIKDRWSVDEADSQRTASSGAGFSESDWDEGGAADVLVDKVWKNLSKKMDEADFATDLAMMFEFIGNHVYNRMIACKKMDSSLAQRAYGIYKQVSVLVELETDGWSIDHRDMQRNGEYLKVANAVSTKFKGGDFVTAMYCLATSTIYRLKYFAENQIEAINKEKTLMNSVFASQREERQNKIDGFQETVDRADEMADLLGEALGTLTSEADDYFT